MKRWVAVAVAALLLIAGWSAYDLVVDRAPPHRFIVSLDEPARSAHLALGNANGMTETLMAGGPIRFTASRDIGDASGSIRIKWPDGSTTDCPVGYITNGEAEPHLVAIHKRQCAEIGAHVQG